MNTEYTLPVTEIQRFCMHDGPGVRTTVFLKGCPLRCKWCHNPETQRMHAEILYYEKKCILCGACASVCPHGAHRIDPRHGFLRDRCVQCGACASACPTRALEVCGAPMTVGQILREVEKDRAFYGKNGGLTLSGGEPFAHGVAAVELLRAAKARGLTTAAETCGQADPDVLAAAAPHVDLFLWDVKDTDPERHRRFTGASNEGILRNLRMVSALGARIRLRCILVSGVNTDDDHYRRITALAKEIAEPDGVEFLAYHPYGSSKAALIGLADAGHKEWIPDKAQIDHAKEIVRSFGVRVL